ncbi:DASH complex subunit Dad3-domain-containing protein [Pterulicium gracile]|uniref:DASH complex subunit DAD3 n=1 Tax=Pterulicium gracile TaxID=1884261 RepID=A0A5C3QY09_9AGAR|nr:DASH complex subunit Dad3-domain-containing protein [Pterula gracilis]
MTSTASESLDSVFETNPYASVQNLSSQEAAVLWEYAKLARHLYLVIQRTNALSEQPDQYLVARLRILETKMGLVLTLFKASIWGVINEQTQNAQQQEAGSLVEDDTTIRRD